MDAPRRDRAEVVALLLSHLERHPAALRITLLTADGEPLVTYHVPPASDSPSAARSPAEPHPPTQPSPPAPGRRDPRGMWDVRRALADADPVRLTLRQLADALGADGLEWSERQLSRWLTELTERGEVDNRKGDGDRGTGYGFTHA